MPRVVAFDTETFLFGPGNMAPRVVCLSWADGERSGLVVGDDNIERWLHQHLNQVPLVGHVVAYDAAVIMATFPSVWDKLWAAYADDNITCTAVRERLLDIAAGEFRGRWAHGKWEKHTYSMADISARRLKKEVKKGEDTWRLRYGELDGVPLEQWPQDAVDYAVGDAVTTWEIFRNQEERSRHAHYFIPTQFEDTRADLALRLTSVWGIETDPVQVDKLWIQTVDRMDALVGPLAEVGFAQYKKTTKPGPVRCGKHVPEVKKSLKALRAAITEHYPGGDPPKTAKGAIMTGKDVVRECYFEPLQQLVEFEQLRKVANTYLTKLFASIVHAQFRTVGAASDRTSSHDPNLQNQPRLPGIRECFVARQGRVLLACDFDAQEMRTLAQSCLDIVGYSRLAERFQSNPHFDPHLEFAASLMKISVERAKELKAMGDAEVKQRRQQSKACFHPDTEILTRKRGWVPVGELTYEDEVAAAYPKTEGDCFLVWEKPIALTSRKAPDGELVHLHNENIDLRVTSDHRMLGFIAAGEPRVVKPDQLENMRCWSNAGVLSTGDVAGLRYLSDELLRLAVATQADGSYSTKGIRFGFSKRRKTERLRELLGSFGGWSESTRGRVTSFYIRAGLATKIRALLDSDKSLPWFWVSYPLHFREVIIEEAAFWDGSFIGKGQRSYHYSTTVAKNAEVLQTIAAISGRKSHLYPNASKAIENHKACHQLRISDRAYSRGGALSADRIPYFGDVVCLSVPSSFVLVRDGGVPVITGQCNFGFPGGMGASKFVTYAQGYGINLSESESQDLKDHWFEQWPEMRGYFKHVESLVGSADVGWQTIPQSGFVRGNCGYCDAANGYFQTLAAHASKAALFAACKRAYCDRGSMLYGSRPVVFIHDEIILETPEEAGHEAAKELEQVMIEAMQKWTPDVPSAASATLMRRWSKGAEQVYDGERLVAWEPEEE